MTVRLFDQFAEVARTCPDDSAVTYEDVTFTWREEFDRCRYLAGALESLGAGTGDRIAVLSFNTHWHYLCTRQLSTLPERDQRSYRRLRT